MPASSRFLRLLALLVGCWGAATASAQHWTPSADFLARLSETEKLATGMHELSAQERANLENLVAYEIASARAGNVTGFAGTFSSRRSEAELDATGMDRLSDEQRERLDQHIAGFLADTPRVPYIARGDRTRARTTGDGEAVSSDGPRLEVHGEVSITVGSAGGDSFYGGSMTTVISDPKGRFSAAVTYSTMRGGTPYYGDYYYDRRDPRFRAPGNLGLPPRP